MSTSSTADETSNNKKRTKDASFEILMSSKHFKNEDIPSLADPTPSNALEQVMVGGQQQPPCAFDNNKSPVVSKDEILDYLDRHPNWYYLFGELIRIEREEKESFYKKKCPNCKSYGENSPSCVMEACRACGYLGEDPVRKATEKIIEKNMNKIRSSLINPPTGVPNIEDYADDQEYEDAINSGWSLTQELKECINLPARLSSNQKNTLLPPPPNRPNKHATITAIEVHFRKEPERDTSDFYDPYTGEYHENEPYDPDIHYKKICGWTFFYDDSIQIPIGYTKDAAFETDHRGNRKPICRHTAKIRLEKGEHIVAIDTGEVFGASSELLVLKMFAFYTTKGRWLVAEDGVSGVGRPNLSMIRRFNYSMPTAKATAPEGTAFQFFEVEDFHQYPSKKIKNPITFVSIPNVSDSNDRVGMPAFAPLYAKCEDTLQAYYKKKADTVHSKAYDDLEEFEKEDYEESKKISQSFAERLNESTEAKTIRILNHLINFAVSKMEVKRNVLMKHAREAYAPSYEASRLRIEQHKRAALEKVVRIYEDHAAFRKKCELLSGSCDDENDVTGVVGTERQVCFLCRKVYQPKKLPFLKRCQARGCSSAFWNCGCGITICRDRCKGIYCEDHCSHPQDSHSKWSD